MKKIELFFRNYFENEFLIFEVVIKTSSKKILSQIEPNFKIFHKIDEEIINFIKKNIKNYENFVKIEINKNFDEKFIVQKIYFSNFTKNETINFKPFKKIILYTPLENLCNNCIMKKECFEKGNIKFSRQKCKNFIEK